MIQRAIGGRGGFLVALLGLCLVMPKALLGQEKVDSTPQVGKKPGEPAPLVFVREVFSYPSAPRRNPFVPLTSSETGPRFEQLRLMGVIYDDREPANSVAMLGTSTVRTSQDSTNVTVSPQGQAWYLKVGETVGNVRVAEIRPDYSIVVDVDEFGIMERKVMRMDTSGGTQ